MTTSSVSGSSSTSSAVQQSAVDKLSGNFDTFLKLLTAQLQNQDPTKPLDTNEFTQQLVQYSQVEQQIKTNDQLKSMVTNIQNSTNAAVIGYLGENVTVDGSIATLAKGQAQWTYTLPADANTVNLTVKDSAGKTVRFLTGDASKGDHTIAWDGRDSNRNNLPDGQYTLTVDARDTAGTPITTTMTSVGKVDSIKYDSAGTPQLIIGGKAYQTSSILAVQAVQAATQPTTPPTP